MENDHKVTSEKSKEGKSLNKVYKKNVAKLKKVGKSIDKKVWIIVASALVFVFCAFAIVGFGVYKFNWNNGFVNTIVKTLPYPAAVVDGQIVKYSDWQFEVTAVKTFSEKRFGQYDQAQVEKDVLQKLIQETMFRKLARGYDVDVTAEELNKQIEDIATQLGGDDKLQENVSEYFGWNVETFKNKIIYPEALRQKLIDEISQSERSVSQAEREADKILRLVNKGDKSFDDLATEYSQDPGSATSGGDLGWFPRGVMVKEFEDAAFSLEPGQVSELIKTQYGFHIIKVEEKKIVDEDVVEGDAVEDVVDEDIVEGEEQIADETVNEQVKARHILIKFKDFNEFLSDYQSKAKVYKFVALDK
jgi:foldase protein PrsA